MVDLRERQLDADAVRELAPASLCSLDGRVALVTGAGGGLGRWLAAGLGAAGASVALADRNVAMTTEIRQVLSEAGVECASFAADLLDPAAPDQLVEEVVERFGCIDVLVNNAAINRREPALEMSVESWDAIAAVDLRAPVFLARAAAPGMRDREGGSIINVGSINIAIGLEGVAAYGAQKAALAQATKALAVEWAQLGIRVNCLAPGFMLSPLSRGVWEEPVRRRWLLERSPLRRPGKPHELVGACLLLASDAGSFITGQTIYIDGGFLAGTPWTVTVDPDGVEGVRSTEATLMGARPRIG